MTLRINAFNHFAALFSLFVATILILAVLMLVKFDQDFLLVFGIFYAFDAFPAIYLHVQYYQCNRGEKYEIRSNEVIQYKSGVVKRYYKNEIERVVVYMAPSVYQGSCLHFLAIESYHFARVFTKDGEELLITCLLAPKVEEALKRLNGAPCERKKLLFCTTAWR